MSQRDPENLFENYWRTVCAKARRPLEGIRLPDERVLEIATEVFEAFIEQFSQLPARAELGKFMLERARRGAMAAVAEERAAAGDAEIYAQTEERFHAHNLQLAELQRRSADGRFTGAEWERLPVLLRPRAMAALKRGGIPDSEREDLFNESLAALVKISERSERAPIEALTVFEEILPLFTTMVHNRAVSWQRKQSANKNRPNAPAYGDSLDDPQHYHPPACEEPAGPWDGLTFDRIYEVCRDCLSELEWHLLSGLFVEANKTRGELAADPWVMQRMAVAADSSMASKRRHLNGHLQSALDKLGSCLRNRDL